MNELNISNEVLLNELSERIKKGEIKLQGRYFTTKDSSYAYALKVTNIGYLVNDVIRDLEDEVKITRREKERWEQELAEYKKQS